MIIGGFFALALGAAILMAAVGVWALVDALIALRRHW